MDIRTSPGCKRRSMETTHTVSARMNPWRILSTAVNPAVAEPKCCFDPHAGGRAEDLVPKAGSRRRALCDLWFFYPNQPSAKVRRASKTSVFVAPSLPRWIEDVYLKQINTCRKSPWPSSTLIRVADLRRFKCEIYNFRI